jgi:hypothetical protein
MCANFKSISKPKKIAAKTNTIITMITKSLATVLLSPQEVLLNSLVTPKNHFFIFQENFFSFGLGCFTITSLPVLSFLFLLKGNVNFISILLLYEECFCCK